MPKWYMLPSYQPKSQILRGNHWFTENSACCRHINRKIRTQRKPLQDDVTHYTITFRIVFKCRAPRRINIQQQLPKITTKLDHLSLELVFSFDKKVRTCLQLPKSCHEYFSTAIFDQDRMQCRPHIYKSWSNSAD